MKFFNCLSTDIYPLKESIRQKLLDEGHLVEIMILYVDVYLSPWFTIERYGLDTATYFADAKGITRPTVSWRLKYHDELSDNVKNSVCQKLIDEGHIHEIMHLCVDTHLSPLEFVGQKMIDEWHLFEIMQLSVNRHLSSWFTIEEANQKMIYK